MGKLIYQPKGAAQEYCKWACNIYNGCSNRCTYCYNRKGVACKLLGKDDVTIKKGLVIEEDVKKRFLRDYRLHADEIHSQGNELFFNFVSDPCLPETIEMNMLCVELAILKGIDVRMLTKRKEIAERMCRELPFHKTVYSDYANKHCRERMHIGFTLTGRDDLEPGASTNAERIEAMRQLVNKGFKTWASIEPVIDIPLSFAMIGEAYKAGCREFKIGLLSGKRTYNNQEVLEFKRTIDLLYFDCNILWKRSVVEAIDKIYYDQPGS